MAADCRPHDAPLSSSSSSPPPPPPPPPMFLGASPAHPPLTSCCSPGHRRRAATVEPARAPRHAHRPLRRSLPTSRSRRCGRRRGRTVCVRRRGVARRDVAGMPFPPHPPLDPPLLTLPWPSTPNPPLDPPLLTLPWPSTPNSPLVPPLLTLPWPSSPRPSLGRSDGAGCARSSASRCTGCAPAASSSPRCREARSRRDCIWASS